MDRMTPRKALTRVLYVNSIMPFHGLSALRNGSGEEQSFFGKVETKRVTGTAMK